MDIYEEQERQEEAEAERKRLAAIQLADFKAITSTVEGRRFFRRALAHCAIYQSSFTGDAQSTAYNEGRRSVGLWLLSLFDDCPEVYLQLLTEQNNDRISD